jgi:hypothetical protein
MVALNISIVRYSDSHFDGVAALWGEAFPDDPPWNRAEVAIPAKIAVQPELLLVAVDGDRVVGSAMAGRERFQGAGLELFDFGGREPDGDGLGLVSHGRPRHRPCCAAGVRPAIETGCGADIARSEDRS